MDDREYLINFDKDNKLTKQGLDRWHLIAGMIIFFGIMILTLPKIFFANSIYYKSKEIYDLQINRDILIEENKRLKRELDMFHLMQKDQND